MCSQTKGSACSVGTFRCDTIEGSKETKDIAKGVAVFKLMGFVGEHADPYTNVSYQEEPAVNAVTVSPPINRFATN